MASRVWCHALATLPAHFWVANIAPNALESQTDVKWTQSKRLVLQPEFVSRGLIDNQIVGFSGIKRPVKASDQI